MRKDGNKEKLTTLADHFKAQGEYVLGMLALGEQVPSFASSYTQRRYEYHLKPRIIANEIAALSAIAD